MYLLQISFEMRIFIGIAAMALLFVSFIVSFVTGQRKKLEYHHNMQELLKQKQELLTEQNEKLERNVADRTAELNEQKKALQQSLKELKATQAQLLQIEKLASLGEMTAGIAHEIQNPLNFIGNFSEVSIELFEEMNEEIKKQNLSAVQELSNMLQGNLAKIKQHSNRADKIVKSMLEHSRKGSGSMTLVNINDLVKESYTFSFENAIAKTGLQKITKEIKTDTNIPPINLSSQEISRVIENICHNALYSVIKKYSQQATTGYEPSVKLETKLWESMVKIMITDNGLGIPKEIMDKIFQPFFTTKPAGEGTGLGLSLSYDIITNMHGGNLSVESEEGEGATFTISLPIHQE